MSMITELVKRLRKHADVFAKSGSAVDGIVKDYREAADVIEELSAKLQVANMERSSQYYNGGWIPVSEKLPEWHWETVNGEKFWIGERVLACVKEADEYYDLVGVATYGPSGWKSSDEDFCSCYASKPVIAWMPLPEPYKQEVEE